MVSHGVCMTRVDWTTGFSSPGYEQHALFVHVGRCEAVLDRRVVPPSVKRPNSTRNAHALLMATAGGAER